MNLKMQYRNSSKGKTQAIRVEIIWRKTGGQFSERELGKKVAYLKIYPNFYHSSIKALLGFQRTCFSKLLLPGLLYANYLSCLLDIRNFLEMLLYKGKIPFIGPLWLHRWQGRLHRGVISSNLKSE